MNKRRIAPILMMLVLALLASGCSAKQDQAVREAVMVEKAMEAPAAAPMPTMAMEGRGSNTGQSVSDVQLETPEDRMIIQTVSLTVVVEDTDETMANIGVAVEQAGGYISESNRWLRNDQPWANLTIRVPAGSLSEVRDMIKEEAIRVENENLSGQDVTEEFVDTQARLRNLEATETELLELLTEVRKNRGKAEDVLAIHREITDIRGQIESLQGRSNYLQRMTAMATIHLEIRPKEAPRAITQDRWSPLVTISNAVRGFLNVLEVFADVLIWLIVFSPFVIIPAALIWLLARTVKRRRARRQDESPKEPQVG